jgi:cytochrome c peroxidase
VRAAVRPLTRALVATAAAAAAIALVASCSDEAEPEYVWDLPPGFPKPPVPPDNKMSEAKVALGQRLFFEKRLSGNETASCASCHDPRKAFSDGRAVAVGSTGEPTLRNAMAIVNVAYLPTLTWANPMLRTLEAQALVPLFGEAPVELGAASMPDAILARLEQDASYPAAFRKAFPGEPKPINFPNIAKAIASFERTLISGRSAYDRFVYDKDRRAMSASAIRGMELFFSEKCECYHCHAGPNFSTAFVTAEQPTADFSFLNTGLYNIGGRGEYPPGNRGLAELTGEAKDVGRFRVPTLRNVEWTAPYMHDGSIATLEEVIDHYAAGGRTIESGPYAGVGREHPNKDPLVLGFTLTAEEKADLVAFLKSLSDPEFVERFAALAPEEPGAPASVQSSPP